MKTSLRLALTTLALTTLLFAWRLRGSPGAYPRLRSTTRATERSFAWIVSSPIESYDPTRYLAVELASQLLVALLIVAMTVIRRELPAGRRTGVVAVMALGAGIATYGQLMNWWGCRPGTQSACR